MKKWFIRVAIAVVVLGGVVYVWRGKSVLVETAVVTRQDVREYIAEDGKTRLAREYLVDVPVAGRVDRIALNEGDTVKQGECIVTVDAFALKQQIAATEALCEQARAQMTGVDKAKPKPEDLASAEARVGELRESVAAVARERSVAEINLANAEKEYERLRALREQGAASQSALDAAERTYKSLQEEVRRAALAEKAAAKACEAAELASKSLKASVDDNEYMREVYAAELARLGAETKAVEHDVRLASVTAPVTGMVLEKYVDSERTLAPGMPLLKLGDLADIEIESDILSEEVVRVREGMPVEILGKALAGKTLLGKVKRIYPSAFTKISALGVEQQRVKVLVSFDNSELQLRPGTSVDVRIITAESKGVLSVPESAVFRHEEQWHMFVAQNGRAKLVDVEMGLRNDTWAEIKNGVNDKERVITNPPNDLADGAKIKIRSK